MENANLSHITSRSSSHVCLFPDTTDQPKHLVADSEGAADKSVSEENDPPANSTESKKSPKRPNDESSVNPKKKVGVTVTVPQRFKVLSSYNVLT